MKKKFLLLLFGVIVGLPAICQVKIDRVYKDANKIWKGDVSGPLTEYPASGLIIADTSEIPDPVTPPDSIPPDPNEIITATDINPGTTTFTNWENNSTKSDWYAQTISFSSRPNSSMRFEFAGYRVDFFAEKMPTHGTGRVKIFTGDKNPTLTLDTVVSFIGPDALQTLIFSKKLTNDFHALELSWLTKYVLADYVKVYSNDDTPKPPEPPPISCGTCNYRVGPQEQYKTIQAAASVARNGETVCVLAGTYRETIIPSNNGVIFMACGSGEIEITGLNEITTPWTLHSGNIYKTSITLPVNGHQSTLSSNTTLLANQIFKGKRMMFEARWPDIATEDDLLNQYKLRNISQMVSFNGTNLTDNGVPDGMSGAKLIVRGWFWPTTRIVNSQNGKTLNYNDIHGDNYRYRRYYYLTGKLSLLNVAKEWHYENGTLYFYQEGGGTPTGVEYKARNWAFDLRGKSNITIKGLKFFGCEPVTTDPNSANILIDGIKAKFTNHSFMLDKNDFPGYGNALQTGIKLIGPDSRIQNSEIQWVASHCIWLGERGVAQNNLIQDVDYEGSWGAAVSIWDKTQNQTITRNTIRRTGRSNVDLGYNYKSGAVMQNHNVKVTWNDMSKWGMINIDLGAVYSWGFRDMTGSVIAYNWIHDCGVLDEPGGAPLDGMQSGTYFDQASGPFTVHHNVYWNGYEADHYTQPQYEHRNAGPSYVYNNTFGSTTTDEAYITYINNPKDVQRNNVYMKKLVMNWGSGNPSNTEYCLNDIDHPSNASFTDPKFVGSGQSGLDFRPRSGSPLIDRGTVIEGITTGTIGAPDIGAYEYGGESWVPGYVPVSSDPEQRKIDPMMIAIIILILIILVILFLCRHHVARYFKKVSGRRGTSSGGL